jgi:hypothetical protein
MLVAAWFTAIATGLLAVFAVVTAWYARKAFRAQFALNELQTPVLDLQARELRESLDERKRDRQQRHRDQASRVFTWIEEVPGSPPKWAVRIRNASDRPIYEVNPAFTSAGAWYGFNPEPAATLMPGTSMRRPREDGVAWAEAAAQEFGPLSGSSTPTRSGGPSRREASSSNSRRSVGGGRLHPVRQEDRDHHRGAERPSVPGLRPSRAEQGQRLTCGGGNHCCAVVARRPYAYGHVLEVPEP